MAVPDLHHIVQQVRDGYAWDFTTEAGLCQYSNAVVVALHATDGVTRGDVRLAVDVDPQSVL